MSTPAVTILKNRVLDWETNEKKDVAVAKFYRHWDGYCCCDCKCRIYGT